MIEKEEEFSDEVDSGEIISQTPDKGSEVDPESDTISFKVSKGPETVTLRSYVGQNL